MQAIRHIKGKETNKGRKADRKKASQQAYTQIGQLTDVQRGKQTGRQRGKQASKQTEGKTDRKMQRRRGREKLKLNIFIAGRQPIDTHTVCTSNTSWTMSKCCEPAN